MRVCAVAGGVGSARFCTGLARVLDPGELTVVVNTGDDERIRGLLVCPDLDTVLYHLAASTDWGRGWGMAAESFVADERYRHLVDQLADERTDLQEWFALGDRDLATHLLRARLLETGSTLTQAVGALARALGIAATVLPMSDDPVRTKLTVTTGEELDFQEYFVRRKQQDEISAVAYAGAVAARPAPGVIEAIASADVVVIPPSNPPLSIGPVLAVPGIRDAIASARGVRVGVSPIVGGRALKGPADRVLASLGHDVSPVGVARIYEGLLDAFVLDEADASRAADVDAVGPRAVVCDTIMSGPEEAARVAKTVLDHVLRA
ncbi:MAG: 2-phospho-L-lactate transferase [Actinomycetota bacterium]